jgi:transglutaminase-like putative cysteine protease
MRIRLGYDLVYECPAPTPMMLMLSVRPERLPDLVTPQVMSLEPKVPVREYVDSFGNICTRLIAPPGPLRLSADFVIADSGLADAVEPAAAQHDIDTLPDEALIFLMPSRYCEADRLSDEAWRLFGSIAPGWARVQAIVDFVHHRITFGYPHARPTRSAFEGLKEQVGVCRDFAHLAVTLCRCMNIPARYCTGYLGDIGVPYGGPMDFSAWFEVYLGGRWYTFDARHNTPRVGRVAMAYGRDAADTAISTNFGPATLTRFEVIAEEVT